MKINKKFLNWSAWITVAITYVLPYQSTDGFATKFGHPFTFLTVYDVPINTSLLMTESLDYISFALNIMIVYFVISFVNAQVVKRDMNKSRYPK